MLRVTFAVIPAEAGIHCQRSDPCPPLGSRDRSAVGAEGVA